MLTAGLVAASRPAGAVADAATLGRGGAWLFDRMDLAPGAAVAGGVAVDVARIDPEAGIEAGAVRVVHAAAQHAWGLAFEQIQSPVHRESLLRVTWQHAGRGAATASDAAAGVQWRAGLTVQAARRDFDRYGAWWRGETRAGAGWFMRRGGLAVVLSLPWADEPVPQLCAGIRWRAGRHTVITAQSDARPAMPGALHVGWSFDAGGLGAAAGYDGGANSVGVALDVPRGKLHIIWGARMHPQLGWSHAWSCWWQR